MVNRPGCSPAELSDEELSLCGRLAGEEDYYLISAEQKRRTQTAARRRNERQQRGRCEHDRTAFERHYRLKELAELWGLARNTIGRMFQDEAGVLRVSGPSGYTTTAIPESIALRVHKRFSENTLKPLLAVGSPLGVMPLGDSHIGMSKKPRNVVNLQTIQ